MSFVSVGIVAHFFKKASTALLQGGIYLRGNIWRLLRTAGGILAAWLAVRYLLPLLMPFLLGLALAVGAEPMARFFRRRLGIPRRIASGISVSMAFCFLAAAGMLLCALVIRELRALAGILPELAAAAQTGLTGLEEKLVRFSARLPGELGTALAQSITALFTGSSSLADRAIGYLLGLAGTILSHIPRSFLGIGTAVISGYMISARLSRLRAWILRRVPREKLRGWLDWWKRMKTTLLRYLTAQMKLSAVTFGILLAGFWWLRVPYPVLWALAVALVDAFPVLGTGTVLVPWAVLTAVQGQTVRALGLAGLYAVVCVCRSVLEPRFLGKHLGLDPLVTLIAMYTGFRLLGLGGMILAPMLAVTVLGLRPPAEK